MVRRCNQRNRPPSAGAELFVSGRGTTETMEALANRPCDYQSHGSQSDTEGYAISSEPANTGAAGRRLAVTSRSAHADAHREFQ